LQIELPEENHHHFNRVEHNKYTSRKKKIITLNVIKKFCMRAQNRPETV